MPSALPPGPRFPAIVQTALYMRRPAEFLAWAHRRYGDPFTIQSVIFGTEVIVVRPELVKEVFTADPDVLRAGEANLALRALVGTRSVLTLDGAEHLRHRRLMLPSFHGDRMQAYATVMAGAAERAQRAWSDGERVKLHRSMQRITLDVILRAVFGVEEGSRFDALRGALRDLLDQSDHPLAFVALFEPAQRDLGPLTPWREFVRMRGRADELIREQIRARRAAPAGDDVLSMLFEARDEAGQPLGEDELRDELMTLLAAGHETTATALCWAFEEILRHPRVEAKLRDELAAVVGGAALTGEHIARLPYLDAVIRETLRLHPVVPAVGRRVASPWTLAGRWTLPKGTLVVPLACETHMLASLYPDPERFDPTRFLDKKPDLYGWYPFGGGTRRCLGMAFALYEAKVVLATLLRRMRLRLTTTAPPRITVRGVTFAPRGGTEAIVKRVAAEARQPESLAL